jgi:hypothetical protein
VKAAGLTTHVFGFFRFPFERRFLVTARKAASKPIPNLGHGLSTSLNVRYRSLLEKQISTILNAGMIRPSESFLHQRLHVLIPL